MASLRRKSPVLMPKFVLRDGTETVIQSGDGVLYDNVLKTARFYRANARGGQTRLFYASRAECRDDKIYYGVDCTKHMFMAIVQTLAAGLGLALLRNTTDDGSHLLQFSFAKTTPMTPRTRNTKRT